MCVFGPEHFGGQLLCLGECLGVVGRLGVGCLVAVGGGLPVGLLAVGLLALCRLVPGEGRGQAAQQVKAAGKIGLVLMAIVPGWGWALG